MTKDEVEFLLNLYNNNENSQFLEAQDIIQSLEDYGYVKATRIDQGNRAISISITDTGRRYAQSLLEGNTSKTISSGTWWKRNKKIIITIFEIVAGLASIIGLLIAVLK